MATLRSYESNGIIKDGVLSIRNRKLFDKALLTIGDCECEIKVSKKFRKRTSPQNRYYWSVIVQYWMDLLTDSQGEIYSKVQTHEFLKTNFNFKEIVSEVTGKCYGCQKAQPKIELLKWKSFTRFADKKHLNFLTLQYHYQTNN